MEFYIQFKNGYKKHKVLVQLVHTNERVEHWKVIGANKTVVLESNRPLFRNKGLMHRKPDWKLVEGKLDYAHALEVLAAAILEVIEPGRKGA